MDMIVDIMIGVILLLVLVVGILYIRDLKKIEDQQREIMRLKSELEKRKI